MWGDSGAFLKLQILFCLISDCRCAGKRFKFHKRLAAFFGYPLKVIKYIEGNFPQKCTVSFSVQFSTEE